MAVLRFDGCSHVLDSAIAGRGSPSAKKDIGGGKLMLTPFKLNWGWGWGGSLLEGGAAPCRASVFSPLTAVLALSREACNEGEGDPPLYVNVNMFSGQLMNTWIDSLQAFFPGLQVLGLLSLRERARGRGGLLCSRVMNLVRSGSFALGRLVAQYVCIGVGAQDVD